MRKNIVLHNGYRLFFSLVLLLLSSCSPEPETKVYTVGVINFSVAAEPAFTGLKQGLQELGYIEGENIRT